MFVGGLNYETTDDTLRKHFEKYGNITDVIVMKDRDNGRWVWSPVS